MKKGSGKREDTFGAVGEGSVDGMSMTETCAVMSALLDRRLGYRLRTLSPGFSAAQRQPPTGQNEKY